ncbi:hypothetical protein CAAN3_05S00496 [[Candida] anglica]
MHSRSFSLDKLKNKVSRRSSSEGLSDFPSLSPDQRRNSLSNPMIVITESGSTIPSSSHGHHGSSAGGSGPAPATSPPPHGRFRAKSLTINHSRSRSRSRSRTESTLAGALAPSTSPGGPGSGSGSGSSSTKKATKALIKQEISTVISKKLVSFLQDFGLQGPINLPVRNSSLNSSSDSIKIYVANTSDCIYLPPATSASFTYEDVENGRGEEYPVSRTSTPPPPASLLEEEQGGPTQWPSAGRGQPTVPPSSHGEATPTSNPAERPADPLMNLLTSFHSPNYLSSKIDADLPIPHTFAVIVELPKAYQLKDLRIRFQSLVNIFWPSGDPFNKTYTKERFKIGLMEWRPRFEDADYYINTSNSSDVKSRETTKEDLVRRTRSYRLVDIESATSHGSSHSPSHGSYHGSSSHGSSSSLNSRESPSKPSASTYSSSSSSSGSSSPSEVNAGIYVFLLPILLPEHIPANIASVNGSLSHNLTVQFQKISAKLNRKSKFSTSYDLPMVRTPPSFANSIADKPIYVNRIWNDSLHYSITFPKKYVSLGSEHQINVKLVPLVKDVVIKRIKFNVLERITYVSKNLAREQDYDSEDPFYLKYGTGDTKVRERVVSICELKTKTARSGSSESYKEEVVKCKDNNLLFSCYEEDHTPSGSNLATSNQKTGQNSPKTSQNSPKTSQNGAKTSQNGSSKIVGDNSESSSTTVMIASPLDINIALPFLTTKADKTTLTTSGEESNYLEASGRNSIFSANQDSSRRGSLGPFRHRSDSTTSMSSPVIGAMETNIHHGMTELSLDSSNGSGGANSSSSSAAATGATGTASASSALLSLEDSFSPDSSNYMSEDTGGTRENISAGYTVLSKALYPDSNFRHIQIHHRLQVCFRISKPDPRDGYKMHHYEVVVDTPFILLSAKCDDESIQLPKYDELEEFCTSSGVPGAAAPPQTPGGGVSFRTPSYTYSKNGVSIRPLNEFSSAEGADQLPTFEEATSNPGSPITRSVSFGESEPLSRIPSISMADPAPAYEVEDSNMSHLGGGTIDEIVQGQQLVMPHQDPRSSFSETDANPSRIRSSLVNSFAPVEVSNGAGAGAAAAPPVSRRRSSSSCAVAPDCASEETSDSAPTTQSGTQESVTDPGDTDSASMSGSTSGSVDVNSNSNSEGRDSPVGGLYTAVPEPYIPSMERPRPTRLDTGHSSLFTQDSEYAGTVPLSTTNTLNFDQGLSLLENYSRDDVEKSAIGIDKNDQLSIITAESINPTNGGEAPLSTSF